MPSERRHETACGGCRTRREFLGEAPAVAAAIAAALGVPARLAAAWTVDWTGGTTAGEERTYTLPGSDGVTIDRDAQIILVRVGGAVYAFNLACPHENTALKWRQADSRFQCPRHESKYRPDGVFIEGRATRNMDRFPVRRDGANVVVDLSRLLRSDQHAPEWAAARITL